MGAGALRQLDNVADAIDLSPTVVQRCLDYASCARSWTIFVQGSCDRRTPWWDRVPSALSKYGNVQLRNETHVARYWPGLRDSLLRAEVRCESHDSHAVSMVLSPCLEFVFALLHCFVTGPGGGGFAT